MALFGWCLPDMDIAHHTLCIEAFEYGTTIACSCLCHTDYQGFVKSKTAPPKSKKSKQK